MEKSMCTQFIQEIDELLYVEEWFPKRFHALAKRIKEAETEEELLSLEFGRAESAIIGNACIRYAVAMFPGADGHGYSWQDLRMCQGRMKATNFMDKEKYTLSEIDDIVDRYIDGTYDAYVWNEEQKHLPKY